MKKHFILLIGTALLGLAACSKNDNADLQLTSQALARQGADDSTVVDDRGGHGADDSVSHNNGDDNSAIIKEFKLGSSSLKSGRTDSIRLVLRRAAPAGGYTVSLRSSDASVQIPASVTLPAGMLSRYVVITSTPVSSTRKVIVTAAVGSQSRSDNFNLLP